jgi:NAD(P)-dependent dehydrogenase (short-subunit alcohol dehydrogenase family)
LTALRFDGRVAIVTGAGRNPGLGRSYALLLAERGARVVVNDVGPGAELVVQEIREAGGEAVPDAHSVAEEESARAVVATALEAWGRVDALVNNAGVARLGFFSDVPSADIEAMVAVHLLGHIWMCRAVWPVMRSAGYGRIVNVTSASMFGLRRCVVYGAVKGGVFSLTRGLAVEGERYGIRVNVVGPTAATAAIGDHDHPSEWANAFFASFTPEHVAPAVALLAHEDCPWSGKYLEVGGGRVAEKFVGETVGHANPELTVEDLVDNLDRVVDREGFVALGDLGIGL